MRQQDIITMSRQQDFRAQRRRICCWDLQPQRLDSFKVSLEQQLRFLPQMTLYRLKALDDPELFPCDLLIVYCWHFSGSEMLTWLEGYEKRLKKQQAIWIPSLIVTPLALNGIPDILERTLQANWYFDLLHPDHLSSLPVRVANLLRIHDHLHELERYEAEISRLQSAVQIIELELENWKAKEAGSS